MVVYFDFLCCSALHQAIVNKKIEAVQNFVRVIETIPAPYTLNQYNNMRQVCVQCTMESNIVFVLKQHRWLSKQGKRYW